MVAPRIRMYRCIKCNKTLFSGEIEWKKCLFCFVNTPYHKDCGGRCVESKLLGLRH